MKVVLPDPAIPMTTIDTGFPSDEMGSECCDSAMLICDGGNDMMMKW